MKWERRCPDRVQGPKRPLGDRPTGASGIRKSLLGLGCGLGGRFRGSGSPLFEAIDEPLPGDHGELSVGVGGDRIEAEGFLAALDGSGIFADRSEGFGRAGVGLGTGRIELDGDRVKGIGLDQLESAAGGGGKAG